MPVRPIQYGPTQYPMRYRPLGYGTRQRADDEEPAARAIRPQGRRRITVVLIAFAATLLLHAGIAFAYLGNGNGHSSPTATTGEVEPGDSCGPADESGLEDPSLSDPANPDSQGRNGSSDPTDAERRLL